MAGSGTVYVLATNLGGQLLHGDRYIPPGPNGTLVSLLVAACLLLLIGLWLARHVLEVGGPGRRLLAVSWLVGLALAWGLGTSLKPVPLPVFLGGWLILGGLVSLRTNVLAGSRIS